MSVPFFYYLLCLTKIKYFLKPRDIKSYAKIITWNT